MTEFSADSAFLPLEGVYMININVVFKFQVEFGLAAKISLMCLLRSQDSEVCLIN